MLAQRAPTKQQWNALVRASPQLLTFKNPGNLYAVDMHCSLPLGIPSVSRLYELFGTTKPHHKFRWNERRRALGRIKLFIEQAIETCELATGNKPVFWMPLFPKLPADFLKVSMDPLEPSTVGHRRFVIRAHSTNRQLLRHLHGFISECATSWNGSCEPLRVDHNPALFEVETCAADEKGTMIDQ